MTNIMFGGADCYYCGKIKPLEDLRAQEIWVESTRAGGSITYRGSMYGYSGIGKNGKASRKGGGISYNAGRIYYKKQKVFICSDCVQKKIAEQKKIEQDTRTAVFAIMGVLVILVLWSMIS